MAPDIGKSFQNQIAVMLVKKLSLYGLPVKSQVFTIFGDFRYSRHPQKGSSGWSRAWNFFLVILGTQCSTLRQKIHLKCHTEIQMLEFWLIRPKITNWSINLLRKHFRAKRPWPEGNVLRIQLRSFWCKDGVSKPFLSKVRYHHI